MAMIPGYMYVMKSMPGTRLPSNLLKPAPKIIKNKMGMMKEDAMRDRLFTKRRSSR